MESELLVTKIRDLKERWCQEVSEPCRSSFRKEDAMRLVEWRIYNELAEANDRTCQIMNYFRCPHGEGWRELVQDGHDAYRLWEEIKWYDTHWNRSISYTPAASEMKWYHYDEPPIMDVKSCEDIIRASDR